MHTAEALADWAKAIEISHFPEQANPLAKASVLDAFGCACVSLGEKCVDGIRAAMREQGGAPQATVIGGGIRQPTTTAALVNASLVRALDLNDHLALDPNSGVKLGGHPSDMLSALLAVAEWKQASGRELLTAMLIAYEVYGRSYGLLGPELPWDHATAFGIAVPVAVSRLLRLPPTETANAIALAVSQAATLGGVRRGQLSHSKFLAGPWACERGLLAALMAAHGVTGPLSIFEDSRGFDRGVVRGGSARERLTAPLGRHAMIEGVTIKGFPGIDTTQAAEEAATRVAAELTGGKGGLVASDIAHVEMRLNDHPMTVTQVSDPERKAPESRETADHSFHYLVAVGLLDAEVTPRQFAAGRWTEPGLVALMDRIEIIPTPVLTKRAPGGFPCTLTVTMRDGRAATAEVAYARGHPRNRMTMEEVEAKFRRLVLPTLGNRRAGRIVDLVQSLDTLTSVAPLADELSEPPS
jgi:2-methylcitrate dehydratase